MTAVATREHHDAENLLRPSEDQLLDAWRVVARANQEQFERLSPVPRPEDPWAPPPKARAPSLHTFDPERREPEIEVLLDPDDTLLDVGAGAGVVSLALAPYIRGVRAVDPSPGMTALMREHIEASGFGNVEALAPSAWPPEEPIGPSEVCMAINVTYFVEDIGPFLDAMEEHARRLCIVGATELGTAFQPDEEIFAALHGEAFIRQPARRELLSLLAARRRSVDVRTQPPAVQPPVRTIEQALDVCRGWYLVGAGTDQEQLLRQLVLERFGVGEGRVQMPLQCGRDFSIISWRPARA